MAKLTPAQLAKLDELRKQRSLSPERKAAASSPLLEPVDRTGPLPLSADQEALWMLEQRLPGFGAYLVATSFRLLGPLDVPALSRTFDAIAQRHESLRTTFAAPNGEPVQLINPRPLFALEVVDLSALPAGDREAEALRQLQQVSLQPYALDRGPLFRARLLRLGEGEHHLLLAGHYLVYDGWSVAVLLRDLSALYPAYQRGEQPSLAPLGVQYADYAAWQRRMLASGALASKIAYWRGQLAGAAPVELPTDHPRPRVKAFRGSLEVFNLPRALREGLEGLSRSKGVTLFQTLLAAFLVLLQRYTGQDDLSVRSPVAMRGRPELEKLVGNFVSNVALRVSLAGDPSFDELLLRVRKVGQEAIANQDVPFVRVIEELLREPSQSPAPPFQVMLAYQLHDFWKDSFTIPGLSLERIPPLETGAEPLDLSLHVNRSDEGLRGELSYDPALFERPTILRLIGHYQTLLAAAMAEPSRRITELGARIEPPERTPALAERTGPALEQSYLAPRTPVERTLAGIWQTVFGLPRVGVRDNFFELGGDSTRSMRVLVLAKEAGLALTPLMVFAHPTIAELAESGSLAGIDPDAASTRRWREAAARPVTPSAPGDAVPVSYIEERAYQWWLNSNTWQGRTLWGCLELEGELDRHAFEWAVERVQRRHDVLRSRYGLTAGHPSKQIAPEPSAQVELQDVQALAEDRRAEAAADAAALAMQRTFDLGAEAPIRFLMIQAGPRRHYLMVTAHHIAFDGASLGILWRELSALYAARLAGDAPGPLPRLQYADVARWQREYLQGEALEEARSWWRRKLEGAVPVSRQLPTDQPWAAVDELRARDTLLMPNQLHSWRIPVETTHGLIALAGEQRATLVMVTFAAFAAVLARWAGKTDLTLASLNDVRRRVGGLDGVIGDLHNAVVLRLDASKATRFDELLKVVRQEVSEGFALPELELVPVIFPVLNDFIRGTLFNFQVVEPLPQWQGLKVRRVPRDAILKRLPAPIAQLDFHFGLFVGDDGALRGDLRYNSLLWTPDTIARVAGRYTAALERIVRDPRLPLDVL